ncbi:protoheme IX farnesyltransferase [Plasmodium gonderi]|uniref:Heme O synthase n=1 Tax=Plasmodium gonderi TaxID=77519 RepID=A0A1Y1JMU6_PLAGO|nr:protoheme IX farnesyltransferase [Plasmodium gonderi]GAW81364.1 protoheme IX farnesyltransferase [Plasmodium gonderi]
MLGRGSAFSTHVQKKEIKSRVPNIIFNEKPCRSFFLSVSSAQYNTYKSFIKPSWGCKYFDPFHSHVKRKDSTNRTKELGLVHFYTKCLSLNGKNVQKGSKSLIDVRGVANQYHDSVGMRNVRRVHKDKMTNVEESEIIIEHPSSAFLSLQQVKFCKMKEKYECPIYPTLSPMTNQREQRKINSFSVNWNKYFCKIKTNGELTKRCEVVDKTTNTYSDNQKGDIHSFWCYHLNNYLELSKAKLTLWVTISSTFGYFMLGGSTISEFFSLTLGVYLCSSSANTFNQIIERDIDKIMNRTKRRPLVYNNKISLKNAKIFGILTAVAGSLILYFFNNPLTSLLGVFNIFLYTCVYTRLKRRTPYNTHIGSIVGSIPTLMGCTAVEENLLIPEPWILFITQLLWQFPHFYSLAYLYKDDYLKGKYKMFPLEDKQNGIYTANLCKPYLILLTSLPFVFFFCGYTSYMHILTSLLPNLYIYYKFQKIFQNSSKSNIRSFFKHSLWHIIVLLALSSYHTQIPDNKSSTHSTNGQRVSKSIEPVSYQTDECSCSSTENFSSPEHVVGTEEHTDTTEYAITKFKKKFLKFCIVFS